MNKLKIIGVVRHILTTAGGGLFGGGAVAESPEAQLAGAIVTIIGFLLSYFAPEKKD